jgi:hypothetical protein
VALVALDGLTDSISPLLRLRRFQRFLALGFFL